MADVFSQMGAANNKVAQAKEQRRREEMQARQKEIEAQKAREQAEAKARSVAEEKARAIEAQRQEKLAKEQAEKQAREREARLREQSSQQEREAAEAAKRSENTQTSEIESQSSSDVNQAYMSTQNASDDDFEADEDAAIEAARARAKAQAAANRKQASQPVQPTIEDLVKAEDELYVEKKGRRVSPALWRRPDDEALTKPMTLRPFPRPLVDMLSVAYGANAQNLSATQVVAVACAIALDLTEDEASEIFATAYNDDKAFGVFKAVKRDISTQAGVEHWASRIEKRLDDIAFNVDAAKIAALRNVIDYNGGLDSPGAGANISYENDAVLRGCDKLDEDVKSIRQRQSVKKGRN